MGTYRVPLIPGPTAVPPEVLLAWGQDYPSGDLEPEFFALYAETERRLQSLLGTRATMALMVGEAMVGLWGAMKSCLRPGDRVLAVVNGLFGDGFGAMARTLGCEVRAVESPWNAAPDLDAVAVAVREFRPHMVTMVHGETPSGTVGPVGEVGAILREHGDAAPLFLVDAVATAGGAYLPPDAWGIDLLLIGSQKALSAPPSMAIVGVSERTWATIETVGYQGYDALAPFRHLIERQATPYTPSWQGVAALHAACGVVATEGLDHVIARHLDVAQHCRDRGRAIGLTLYPTDESIACPTVTAFNVPTGIAWPELRDALRARGVAVGGNWGPLAGRVFRVGHMGTQATRANVDAGLDALAEVLSGRAVGARG